MAPTLPQCRGVVLTCIDFRFVAPLRRWLDERGLTGDTDVVAWPGGALRIAEDPDPSVLETLALARRLHSSDEIVLTVHHDCGWLGGSSRFAGREEEVGFLDRALELAAAQIERHLPGMQVSSLRLELSPEIQGN